MKYEVPIDLKEYGWSETLVEFLNNEEIRPIIALSNSSLKVFNSCLESREEYLEEEYQKVVSAYSIQNFPNEYSAPVSNWNLSIGGFKLFSPIKIAIYAAIGFAAYKFMKGKK